jgi:hypothetical protein
VFDRTIQLPRTPPGLLVLGRAYRSTAAAWGEPAVLPSGVRHGI